MKILQLIQKPQLRGAEMFASQLSNHLTELGHEVKIVSLMEGTAVLPFRGEIIKLNRPLSKRFFDFSGWKQLTRIISDFKPDIVQANAGDTLKFAVLSKVVFRWKPPIVFRNANKVSDFVDSWPKLIVNKFFVSQVKHVISVSELCRKDFVKTYSLKNDRSTTVTIGIELVSYPCDVPVDLKDIFATKKVILNVASLVPEKNHAMLIRIAKKLIDDGHDIAVLVVGDGKLKQGLQNEIDAVGLTDRFLLLGYRKDVLSMMANAQVFVLPSLIEGLPGVILESFYCKLPVVANDVGGVSEIVMPQKTGFLIEKHDEEGFTQAIIHSLNSKPSEIVSNAFDLVATKFSNAKIAEQFTVVYKAIL